MSQLGFRCNIPDCPCKSRAFADQFREFLRNHTSQQKSLVMYMAADDRKGLYPTYTYLPRKQLEDAWYNYHLRGISQHPVDTSDWPTVIDLDRLTKEEEAQLRALVAKAEKKPKDPPAEREDAPVEREDTLAEREDTLAEREDAPAERKE